MLRRVSWCVVLAAVVLAGAGCATSFSPAAIRSEIAHQTGSEPADSLELDLGRVTLSLARAVIGESADGALPLAGLTRLQLAVYELPASGTRVDFTRMVVRGWEATVRRRTEESSTLLLVRQSGDALGDVVLVTAGGQQALYARLSGRLPGELPGALDEALTERGTEGLKRELMSIGEGSSAP